MLTGTTFRFRSSREGIGAVLAGSTIPLRSSRGGSWVSRRVGVFGGAFNPPHMGHLVCAQEAHARLGLDSVVLVPVGEAPHRELPGDPGSGVRARLCERATVGDPRLGVSRIEVERPGPSYTVDTLRALSEQEPERERVLILGADQASRLGSWREPETVLELASVGVATREGVGREEVEQALDGLPTEGRLEFFEMPRIDVSSTLVRERVASGLPIAYLVPDAVADEIAAAGLYTAAAGARESQ